MGERGSWWAFFWKVTHTHTYTHTCTQAASALNDQTGKLNQIVDDLNEIEFTMKKASKVIGDISRGLLTDK
jgi:hypothetical protein